MSRFAASAEVPLTDIFHVTHLRNLRSIIESGGLYCDRERLARQISSVGIAHNHIKERRARRRVPTRIGGTLADYVPFYFAPRSPMLYSIHGGFVEQYQDGQAPVLHLTSSAEAVAEAGLAYAFTEGHAELAYSSFFEDLADLDQVDWPVMKSRWWNDTDEDMDRKRRRQAEFLVHEFFPWDLVAEIGVIDAAVAEQVNSLLKSAGHRPLVTVRRTWYY
jgi:hypothetical protein